MVSRGLAIDGDRVMEMAEVLTAKTHSGGQMGSICR